MVRPVVGSAQRRVPPRQSAAAGEATHRRSIQMKVLAIAPSAALGLLALAFAPMSAMSGTSAGGGTAAPGTVNPSGNTLTVPAGTTNGNGDVNVTNSSDQVGSNAKAFITPKEANENASSTVRTQSGFSGTISGLESGDSVELGASNGDSENFQALVYGEGGSVTVGSNSHITITNTGSPGGPNINVTLPGGSQISVQPGSTVGITT